MKKLILFLFLFFITKRSYALVADNLMLMQIMTNTAAQLNEMEQLLSNAEKHTKRLREISEIVEDKLYLAERIELWATDLNYLAQADELDLKEINNKIRELKMKREDITHLLSEVVRSEYKNENEEKHTRSNLVAQKKLRSSYKKQALKSQSHSSVALQNIAHNTGANLVETSKQNEILLTQNQKLNAIYDLNLKEHKRSLIEEAYLERAYAAKKEGILKNKQSSRGKN